MSFTRTVTPSLSLVAAATALIACGGASYEPAQSAGYPAGDSPQHYQPGAPPAPAGIQANDDLAAEESGDFDGGGARDFRPSPAPPESTARQKSAADPFELERPQNRPGLATQWGEQRSSRVTTAAFVRADNMQPFAMGTLFYNDPDGIAAMSDTHGGVRNHMRRFAIGTGHVELGLRDGSGRFLTGFEANGKNFITGIAGRRYTIVVKNHSPGRVEAVVSVDGLDVVDGKPASFNKRGYLIDAHGDLEIEGFRTSNTEVAAFRFGAVRDSYAQKKHGDARNVGVIGMAVFHERGDSPHAWGNAPSHGEVVNRENANPFPQQFASPPN